MDLTIIKQIITEITEVDGNLFRVGTRFLESKGIIYLSYEKDNKSYKFCLEKKEDELKFKMSSYKETSFLSRKYIEHNEDESLFIDFNTFEKSKVKKEVGGDYIKSLNEKL